jgi:phosphoesterase RecJ-like protein
MILEELKKIIKEDDNFLVSAHINPDGDAIGGMLSAGWLLSKLNKRHIIVVDSIPSEKFSYLADFKKIATYSESLKIDYPIKNLLTVDVPNLERLEKVNKLIPKGTRVINIDHHESNSNFGDINFVDIKACSCTQLVYELINSIGLSLDKDVAEYIYTGLVIDTGRFRFSNTTPKAFEIAAKLAEAGARISFIAEWLYHTNSKETLEGLGVLINSLDMNMNGRVAFVHFDNEYLKSKEGSKVDTEGFVNYPLSIENVEAVAFLQEIEKGRVKVSLRAKNNINVNNIAAVFGGGGHAKAAGCRINGTIEDVKKLLLQEINKRLK